MKKKILMLFLAGAMATGMLTGCEAEGKNEEEQYTENLKEQSLDAVGLPNISNFFEMSQLKNIYELRDNPDLICYWYTKNQMTGKWVYEGKCVGYGIPYGASITSPDVGKYYQNGGTTVTAQAEPNGLYTNGVTSSATWILSVGEDGETKPKYVEQEIMVSQEPVNAERCEAWSIPEDY